jgi:peptidoglycan hydrolase-like protein with peptidoglycan-binding domain
LAGRAGAARRPLWAAIVTVVAVLCASAPVFAEGLTASGGAGDGLVERGDRGSAVKRIQRKLRVRPVDGIFGRATERAVRRFQRRNGLTADGVVGYATSAALGLEAVSSYTADGGRSVRLPRVLRRIAECESGGDPTAISPGGQYRGKYQFSRATWRALGGSGDPARASEATQDRLALKLYRRSGTAPWPSCA